MQQFDCVPFWGGETWHYVPKRARFGPKKRARRAKLKSSTVLNFRAHSVP